MELRTIYSARGFVKKANIRTRMKNIHYYHHCLIILIDNIYMFGQLGCLGMFENHGSSSMWTVGVCENEIRAAYGGFTRYQTVQTCMIVSSSCSPACPFLKNVFTPGMIDRAQLHHKLSVFDHLVSKPIQQRFHNSPFWINWNFTWIKLYWNHWRDQNFFEGL